MNICIYASELAVITGHNKYQSENDIILKLWKKYYNSDYEKVKNNLRKMSGIEILEETNIDYINRITKQENIDISKELKECLQSQNTCDLRKGKKTIIDKISKVSNINKKQLTETINQLTNTDFGTKNENKTVLQHGDKDFKLLPNFYKKKVCKLEDEDWYIGGRVDGMSKIDGLDTIVEVKNRVHRLFYKLRDYEKVQVYAYMFIHNIDRAQLIENYRKSDESKINTIDIKWEDNFWNDKIYPKIIYFIDRFKLFMKDDVNKVKLLLDT